ncbi:MAG: hypothetical protein AAF682_10040 [Planctomycetota bacterium]
MTEAAESWCRLARSISMYERDSARTQGFLDDFLGHISALDPKWIDTDGTVEIAIVRDSMYVARRRVIEKVTSNLAWMQERLHRSVLVGAAFAPDVDRDLLLDFCQTLLDNYSANAGAKGFDELWPEEFPGIRLVEMRFAGVFGDEEGFTDGTPYAGLGGGGTGAGLTDEQILVDYLLSDTDVIDHLHSIEDVAAQGVDKDDGLVSSSELVAQIVEVLPVEAFEDVSKALKLTVEVLSRIAGRGQALPADVAAFVDDKEIDLLLEKIGRRFFVRNSEGDLAEQIAERQRANEVPAALRGHAGDDAIQDDLVAFMQEFKKLPQDKVRLVTKEDVDVPAEQLGAYLHYLTHLESEEEAARLHGPLNKLLGRLQRTELSAVMPYLRPEGAGDSYERIHRRLATFLRQTNTSVVFEKLGFLDAEWVVETFPHTFSLYIRRLDFENCNDLDELVTVCNRLGDVRILAEGTALATREGLLHPHVVQALCKSPIRQFMPLVRLILQRGGDEMRPKVIEYLLHAGLDGKEGRLLALLPERYIPRIFLLSLMEPGGQKASSRANVLISSNIIRFVAETADDPKEKASRVKAMELLGEFPSEEANAFLYQIIHRKGLLGGESRAIRKAAKASLKKMSGKTKHV